MSSYNEVLKKNIRLINLLSETMENIRNSESETLSLVLEQDHFHMILESMKEVRSGNVVSFNSAFSDLN